MGLSNVTGASSILQPGVCTSTTRPASPYDGQVIYETDTDKVAVYDVNAWVYKTGTSHVAPALVLISSTTIGSGVTSVTVSNCFSSTYENYKIIVIGGVGSAAGILNTTFGSTATGYYQGLIYLPYNTASGIFAANIQNRTSFVLGGYSTDQIFVTAEIFAPNLAKRTAFSCLRTIIGTNAEAGFVSGFENSATQHTSFTMTTESSHTLTGGTIRVYGYTNS